MTSDELKPCPFCGNTDIQNVAFMPPKRFYFAVFCERCQIQGQAFYTSKGRSKFKTYGFDEAKQLSKDAWNKRAAVCIDDTGFNMAAINKALKNEDKRK